MIFVIIFENIVARIHSLCTDFRSFIPIKRVIKMDVENVGSNKLGVSGNRQTHGRRHVIITYFVLQGGTAFLVKSNAPVEQ